LNSCSLYICLVLEQFHNKKERILWALTFFKGGCAAKWSKNVFYQKADTGVFPIQTWRNFEQQFQLHFFSVNTEADTINVLEGTSYHQEGWTVDDYLDNFQALVSNAGYMDPWTLVVKFRRGLWLDIQNQISTMPYGRPANNDPNTWYRAVQRIDQARLTNKAFQSVLCSTSSTPTKTASTQSLPLSIARLPPVLPLLVTLKPLLPAPSMGVSMDIDATWKARPPLPP